MAERKTQTKKSRTAKAKTSGANGKKAAPHPGGRPPAYTDPEEMQKKVDEYFKSCEGKPLTKTNPDTGEEEQVFDKWGFPAMIGVKPPTITGLALALGFNSRQSLLNYADKQEFMDTVTRAKARVEEYVEMRLFDREGAVGAKFSLTNNFKGWTEKQEVKQELTGKDGGAIETDNRVCIYLPDNGRGN